MTEAIKELLTKGTTRTTHATYTNPRGLLNELNEQLRKDTRTWLHNSMDKVLAEKDRWLGLRRIKQGYTPRPYYRTDRHGNSTSFDKQA